MNNNKMFIDIGRFIAKQIDDIKNYVDKVSGETHDSIVSFGGALGEMAKKQSLFYTDFTSKLKKSQNAFEEKAKVVDKTVDEVKVQKQIIQKEIADNDITFSAMNKRISTAESDIGDNTTNISDLNSTVLDVASETAMNLSKMEVKLVTEIDKEVENLNKKIAISKARLDTIMEMSDDDKNSFKEIVDYIKTVDYNNDTLFYNYVSSNNTRVKKVEDNATNLSNKVTKLTSTVNNNKIETNVEFSSVKTLISTEKARIDSILKAAGADKDSFKEIVDFINSIDLEDDKNLAAFKTNVNATLASYLNMINNRYSKAQSDTNFLGKTANAVSASKLQTPRKLSVSGHGISGSIMFDGSDDVRIDLSFDATKHNHDERYLGISAKAVDSDKLDGLDSTKFLRSDKSIQVNGDLTIASTASKLNFSSENSSSNNMTLATNSKGIEVYETKTPNTKILRIENNAIDSTVPYKLNGQPLDARYLGKSEKAVDSDKLDGLDSSDYSKKNENTSLAPKALSVNNDTITIHKGDGSSESVSIHDDTLSVENVQDIVGGMLPSTFEGVIATYDDESGKISLTVNDPVISLTGDISGSAIMNNLGNVSISATVADDSHNHIISNVDGLQSELDKKFNIPDHDPVISLTGDISGSATMKNLGSVTISATVADDSHKHTIDNITGLDSILSNKINNNSKQIFAFDSPLVLEDGQLRMNFADGSFYNLSLSSVNSWRPIENSLKSTSTSDSLSAYQGKILNETKLGINSTAKAAAKLETSRNISLIGDISGNASFDGSNNIKINTVIAGGSGSGLDADKLDGLHASQFLRSDATLSVYSDITMNAQHQIKFNSTVNKGSDYGFITYDNDNNTYAKWGDSGENSALRLGVANDGANSVSDVIAFESPAGIFLNSPNIFQGTGNKIWHEGNDGSGSGLDADKLDGLHASQFLRSDATLSLTSDITLTSAHPTIKFNGTSDAGIDMAIRATPEGLDFIEPEEHNKIHFQILDDKGVNSKYGYKQNGVSLDKIYLKQNSSPTFDNGTNTTVTIKSDDNGVSKLLAIGNNQGTGVVEVGQSATYGGGMFYNGDSSPTFANGEASDYISFYRQGYGVRHVVFDFNYNNDIVRFRDTPIIKHGSKYSKVVDEETLPSKFKTINGQSLLGSGDIKIESSSVENYASVKTLGVFVNGSSSKYASYTQAQLNASTYINKPLSWSYIVGRTTNYTYNISNIVSPKLELVEKGKFDISASHYDLSDSRVNTYVNFYDENQKYLGKINYAKTRNTWWRNYDGVTDFYDANNNRLIHISTSNWSGTYYGSGALFASVDMSVPGQVTFYPHVNYANSHYFYRPKTFKFNHPFINAKYISLEPKQFRAGYYRSSPSFVVSNIFGGIWTKNR